MRSLALGFVLFGLIAAPAMACGPAATGEASTPRMIAELDAHLAKSQRSEADLAKVKDLRARIETLVAAKQIVQAYKAEEEAMGILGYKKALMRCGHGSYTWRKVG